METKHKVNDDSTYLNIYRYAALAESIVGAAERLEAAESEECRVYSLENLMELAYLMRDELKSLRENMIYRP